MDFTVFFIVLFALQLLCLYAGSRNSSRMKNQNDYFLAGKEVKFFPLLMTFVATQVGGGLVLGSAEEAFKFGWYVLLYPLGACLGFLLLASGIGRKLAKFQVSTVAQLFEVAYKSVQLKRVASLFSIVSLFMILVAQVIASKKFLISLGAMQNEIFLLFWGIVILYTVMGGLKAVVSIDIIQATFFIGVFLFGFGYILFTQDLSFSVNQAEQFDFELSKLSGWLFMPLLFMVIEQDMAQRCFAAQSPKVVTKAATWSAIVIMFICIIPVFIGILGKNLGIDVSNGSSIFMNVVQASTTPWLAALLGCAVLMAIISTAISLINAVSSNVTQDFNLSFLKGSLIKKSRWMTAGIGLGAVFCSYSFDNVVDLLILSYELSVYCLFVPVVVILFKSTGNKLSAVLSIIFGVISFFLFRNASLIIPKEILSVFASAVGYGIGELWIFFRGKETETVFVKGCSPDQ